MASSAPLRTILSRTALSAAPRNRPCSAETLAAYAGTYCFGPSLSSRDIEDVSAASAGVGMEIALQGREARVVRVSAGGPAAKAGILTRDVVAYIDGAPVKGLSLGQVTVIAPAGAASRSLLGTRRAA